jgi:hypothetical protein
VHVTAGLGAAAVGVEILMVILGIEAAEDGAKDCGGETLEAA